MIAARPPLTIAFKLSGRGTASWSEALTGPVHD
jgi:hypothetical protein